MTSTPDNGRKVLYISYDGMTDPLGQSQVLPYLTGLAALGHDITLLSFEKPERRPSGEARIRRICAEAGIEWRPLAYHRRPPVLSSLYDLRVMGRAAERLHREKSFDLVHARSYLPAAAGLSLKRRHGVPLLFDMRGFWPDERVEGGSWPQSSPLYRAVYRRVKQMEADLFAGADRIVSLTEAGKNVLEEQGVSAPIDIIPCCADFGHFRLPAASDRQAARAALGIAADVPVLVYLGSFGSWYMHAEMLDFFSAFRVSRPEARFLIVTQDQPGPILAEAAARGVPPEALIIRPATRDQVPELLAAADIGLFFIAPVPSKRASSPTKMGELMATGLPIVTNAGVGDVGEILDATGCGVAIPSFDAAAYAEAIAQLDRIDRTPDRIRAAGLARFDAAEGVRRYDRIYRAL